MVKSFWNTNVKFKTGFNISEKGKIIWFVWTIRKTSEAITKDIQCCQCGLGILTFALRVLSLLLGPFLNQLNWVPVNTFLTTSPPVSINTASYRGRNVSSCLKTKQLLLSIAPPHTSSLNSPSNHSFPQT